MKHLIKIALVLFPVAAIAQVASPLPEVPVDQVLQGLMALIGGFKGASALAVAVLVVQLLMQFFSSSLGSFAGKYKLLIVYGLSIAAGVLAGMVSGGSLLSSLINANVLAAVQVFGHQIFLNFFDKSQPTS